jgi:hypothetical protein
VASAVKVASGQAVAATAAVALSKEVLKTMFLAKLKLAVGAVMVAAALGAGGVAYQVSGPRPAQAAPESKPQSELEALKKENELLKFNLQVILEKARAQEAELRTLRGQAQTAKTSREVVHLAGPDIETSKAILERYLAIRTELAVPDPVQEVEAALKALREAKDPAARRRAADALEQAVKKLKEQPQKKPEKPSNNGAGN